MSLTAQCWNLPYKSFLRGLKKAKLTTEQHRQLIRHRCRHDLQFFARFFFNDHCSLSFSQLHTDFFEREKDIQRRGVRQVIAAPRGHAKTTFYALIKVIHAIVYQYEPYILIIGYAQPDATRKVADVLEELRHNELLKDVYGPLAPKRGDYTGVARWGTKQLITQNGVVVEGRSKGQSLRGLKRGANRPTFILCDDIESLEGVQNEEQRKKTYDWLMKDILKLGSSDGKINVTVIGTCLHPHALLRDLLQLPGWEAYFYQAVMEFPHRTDLWKTYQTLYSDLTDPHRGATALNFYHSNQALMDAGAKLLWPEADSLPKLYAMMVDEGEASFRSEKQNEPYDPDRQWFAMKDAHYFEFVTEGTTTIGLRTAKQTYFVDRDFERMVAFHDPALAEKSGSDFGAIVVAALDRYGHIYCLDAWVERQPIERQIQQALRMHQKWNFQDLYLETNNFQKLLQTPYKLAREQAGITTLKVHSVDQHTNKLHRISTMQPDLVNGHLLFHRGLCPRFLEQLELFPTAKDDGPDALHGAWSQLRKPRGHIQITPPR